MGSEQAFGLNSEVCYLFFLCYEETEIVGLFTESPGYQN
jgi:hypothetical protein